jgi:hypothetical protein
MSKQQKHFRLVLPDQKDFTGWLLQVVELRDKHGSDIAIRFVEESNKRFLITSSEYNFAISLAMAKSCPAPSITQTKPGELE